MQDNHWRKRCTGWHCDWRDRCENHALPTVGHEQLIVPVHTAEYCDFFVPKSKAWGEGREEND
jgi:hypothetical protein